MGLFDGLLDFIPGGSLVSAGANLVGGLAGALGGSSAADQLSSDNAAARAELAAAKERGIGYIDAATGKATDILTPMTAERPVVLPTYRGLTTQQQIGRDDLIRNGRATLAASGLRGAGRAGVASVMDGLNRYEASARGANDAQDLTAMQSARGSADAAKNRLVDVNVNAGTTKANTELGTGSAIAGNYANQGNGLAQIDQNIAGTVGSAITKAGSNISGGLGYSSGYGLGNSPNLGGSASMYPKNDVAYSSASAV